MTTDEVRQLRNDYLWRLSIAGDRAGMPPDEVSELRDQLAEHLAAAAEGAPDPMVATLNAIDRLGAPEAIVAEAAPPRPSAPQARSRSDEWVASSGLFPRYSSLGSVELAALVVTAAAWSVNLIGAVVAALLIIACTRWSPWARAGAALVVLAGDGIPLLLHSSMSPATSIVLTASIDGSLALILAGYARLRSLEGTSGWRARLTTIEMVALVGITIGWVVGGLGTLTGLGALAAAPRWRLTQKLQGVAAVAVAIPVTLTTLVPILTIDPVIYSDSPLAATSFPSMLAASWTGVVLCFVAGMYLWSLLPMEQDASARRIDEILTNS